MSTVNLLARVRAKEIHLQVQGDLLLVNDPAGALTPELRAELRAHKDGLLALLAPPRAFVTLKQGPTLPVEALELAIDLERRGVALSLDADQQLVIDPSADLNDLDRSRIRRWRWHLAAIVGYRCPEEVPM